jgi:hypothetical protein
MGGALTTVRIPFLFANVGSIVNKSYDFVPCGFVINPDRFPFVDFSIPLFENRLIRSSSR